MTTPGHINVHTHIFNLRAVLTPFSVEIVKKRIAFEVEQLDKVPKVAREQLTKLLQGTVEDVLDGLQDLNEEALLSKFLARLSGHSTVDQLLKERASGLPKEVREWAEQRIEGLLLRQLRRVLSWISGRLRKDQFADYRTSDLHDLFETLRIAGQPDIEGVTEWLLRQLGPEDTVIALMMDLTQGNPADTDAFQRQLLETSQVALSYPGRVLPFVKVNSLRTGELVLNPGTPDEVKLEGHFEIMKHALEHLGYVGVKIYPTLGYAVDSDEMKAVYTYCQGHGVPILMHCNKGGFVTSTTSALNANPSKWRPILEEFKQLKICFAHFGGGGGHTEPSLPADHWGRTILELMTHEGVYCDIAFHRSPMDGDAEARRYQENLEKILNDPLRGGRVLFGTDFWLIRPRLTEANHWKFFQQLVGADRFDQIARDNPRRFLGMGGENDALGNYLDLVAGAKAEELKAMPTTWLLEALAQHSGAAARNRLEKAGARFLPARELNIPSWKQLLGGLADKTFKEGFSRKAKVEHGMTAFAGSRLDFEAGAQFAIQGLAASSGTDPDGILLPAPNSTAADPGPVLDAELEKSWMKYRLVANLDAEAQAKAEGLGLGIEVGASKELVFTDYRVHDPSENVVSAVKSDLSAPRFALSRESVLKLGQNEAVSIQQRGTLRGKMTLALQDVFTGGLGRLSRILGSSQTLRIRVESAATFTAKVRVTDDFKVVFARRGGMYKVVVRKQETNSKSLGVEIGVGIQFDDPAAIKAVLQQLVAQKLSEPLKQLQAFSEKDEEAQLQGREKDLLERLEEKLKAKGLEAVQEKLKGIEEDLEKAIEEIATSRFQVGFSYEYSRVVSNTTVLAATVDEFTLSELHEQLVQGDLEEVLERVRDGVPGVSLERYFQADEFVRRQAWGFNLGGFGRFDVKERRFAAQRSLVDERVKLSFHGSRGYSGPEGERWIWKADFRADMLDLAPQERLTLGTKDGGGAPPFHYGLAFLMEWEPRKLRKTKLRSILDTASIWGALQEDPEELGKQFAELKAARLLGKAVRFRLQLSFDHGILNDLLKVANDGNFGRWAKALSEAMPYAKRKAHANPAIRRKLYAPLWQEILEESQKDQFVLRPADVARKAQSRLREEKVGAWWTREFDEKGTWRNNPWTLGGVLNLNMPIAPWRSFRLALGCLALALEDDQQLNESQVKDRIWAIHLGLSGFWNQGHHIRAVGAFLRACAEEAGIHNLAAASLTATWEGKDGREEGVTLAST